MTTNNTELVASTEDNIQMMKTIANNSQTLDDIKMLTSSKVTDQLKVFLIAQARNELSRVIKLTEFLDKLEVKFMTKVNDSMESDDLTLKQYSNIIEVVTSLLSRSNEIVSKVLKDDSLTTILNTTIYTSGEVSQTSSIASQLKDPQSRERVRIVLQQVIAKTQKYDSDAYNTVTDNLNEESEGFVDERAEFSDN